MDFLPHNIVIENVVMSKNMGKIAYQGYISAKTSLDLQFVKRYDDPSGKGYQRPLDLKKAHNFSEYLKQGDEAIVTPIYLNANGNWEFHPYEKQRPTFGRLFCKSKASLLDGQHRLQGVSIYIKEANTDFPIPFMAFHYLDEDEEIRIFNTINTKHKSLNRSLSRYLEKDHDEIAWISTQLLIDPSSPFYTIGTITGRRNRERHITLQHVYTIVERITKAKHVSLLKKEIKLSMVSKFYTIIKEMYSAEWTDYKGQKLTHITCLQALALVGRDIFSEAVSMTTNQVDYSIIQDALMKLSGIDWSANGPFKYLRGVSGARTLSYELISLIKGV